MSLRVAVIGAGVSGLTTAWELLTDGHHVEVFDANNGIAEGASFASTGCVGAASLVEWDFAGLPSVRTGFTGLLLPPPWARSLGGFSWLRQYMRQQAPERRQVAFNTAASLAALTTSRIRSFNQILWQEVETAQGMLVLLRSDADRQLLQPGLERLKQHENKWQELDRAGAQIAEPALSTEPGLHSIISVPADFVMNGRQWLGLLKGDMLRMGALFHMQTTVSAITPDGAFIATDAQHATTPHRFDAVVVCSAFASSALLKPLTMDFPLWNLDHCSISAPVREVINAPGKVIVDARQRIIISRTGQRIRASSGVPLLPNGNAMAVYRDLYRVLEEWFPGAAHLHGSQALVQNWRASVAHTPDGLPLVGRTVHPKIWLNTGYGGRGWTFAAGAARFLADLISNRESELPPEPLSPMRSMAA